MSEHPFGWLSFLPPIVAIVLAIFTRRVLASLLFGLFVGALVLARGNVVVAVGQLCSVHLWGKLTDSSTLHIFTFTLLMGVMVGIINRGAGMRGLVDAMTPIANNRKRGQLVTWLLGLFVFFDDYANTMLLGNTLRPLTDRLKISREKLAYLVDSTAAPVSGLAIVSTWVAGEIGYITDGVQNINADANWNPFSLFVASIPYRFYVLWTLAFVPMIALLGRDFGPMLAAERGQTGFDDDEFGTRRDRDPTAPDEDTPARWFNAVIPIVVTVAAVVWFLFQSGLNNCAAGTIYDRLAWGQPQGFRANAIDERLSSQFSTYDVNGDQAISLEEFEAWFAGSDDFSFSLSDIFGNADSYGALLWGALAGAVAAVVLIWPQRLLNTREMVEAGVAGALHMAPALGILWLASCLSAMTGNSSNKADDSRLERSTWTAAALEAFQHGTPEVAAYLRREGLDARTIALTVLADSKTKDELRQRLEAAGFAAEAVTPVVELFEETSDGTLQAPYPYQEYRLYSGLFLSSQLERLKQANQFLADNFTRLLPSLVFMLSSLVAFATGTSWGTMGIVMPLVIPLAYAQLAGGGGSVSSADPIMLCSIGGVLAGAIFGDHCSPISDTTVLSSQASGCDHVAHVRTQMPYALLVATVSVLCGTLPIGYGVPVLVMLPIGLVVMWVALLILGRRVDDD